MSEGRPGILLVHDARGVDAWLEGVKRCFEELEFEVALPSVLDEENPGAFFPDRQVQARLELELKKLGAREKVNEEKLAAIGFGAGGTHAFLLGCASTALEAVAIFDSPVVFPELSREHPIQPLEMVLNLSAPLLATYVGEPVGANSKDVDRLGEVGSQFAKDFDILSSPDGPSASYRLLGKAESSDSAEAAFTKTTWNRLIGFLAERLELSDFAAKVDEN